jgi:AcrR family transcriptional regulator
MPVQTEDPRVERTRSRVIEAALALLRAEGPDAVTHSRVAAMSGVGRATVYRHWPDRWALIIDAFESLSMTMTVPTDLSVRESLVAVLSQLADNLDSPMAFAMSSMISRAEHEPEVRAFLDRLLAHASEEIEAALEKGAREEGLVLDVPPETALAALAGPLFYERFIAGCIASRDQIPIHVDGLLARWRPPTEGRAS